MIRAVVFSAILLSIVKPGAIQAAGPPSGTISYVDSSAYLFAILEPLPGFVVKQDDELPFFRSGISGPVGTLRVLKVYPTQIFVQSTAIHRIETGDFIQAGKSKPEPALEPAKDAPRRGSREELWALQEQMRRYQALPPRRSPVPNAVDDFINGIRPNWYSSPSP